MTENNGTTTFNSEIMLSELTIDEQDPKPLPGISFIFEFKINRMPGEDFGFKLKLNENNDWIIDSTISNSPVDRNGFGQCLKIISGDRIISINSYPISMLHIPSFINDLPLLIRLRIQRNAPADDSILKVYNLKPFEVVSEKSSFEKILNKLIVSEAPIKNYMKVSRFIFESFSPSRILSDDIIIKINNVDLFGLTVPEIKDLIFCFDKYIVVIILRERRDDVISDRNETFNKDSVEHSMKPTPFIISNNLPMDRESNIENKSNSESTQNPNKTMKKQNKTKGISKYSMISKGTMTENLNMDLIFDSMLSDSNVGSLKQQPMSTACQTYEHPPVQEIVHEENRSKLMLKFTEPCSIRPVNFGKYFIDSWLRKNGMLNFNWNKFKKEKSLWNEIILELTTIDEVEIKCEVYRGFTIINNVREVGSSRRHHNIKIGDIIISLNNKILLNKNESEITSALSSVSQNLYKLRILRFIKCNENSGGHFVENINDSSEGVFLTIELEKQSVIGFFIDGGDCQPITIRKMYSGPAGARMGSLLKNGDVVLAVNKIKFSSLSYEQAFQILQDLNPGKFQIDIFRRF